MFPCDCTAGMPSAVRVCPPAVILIEDGRLPLQSSFSIHTSTMAPTMFDVLLTLTQLLLALSRPCISTSIILSSPHKNCCCTSCAVRLRPLNTMVRKTNAEKRALAAPLSFFPWFNNKVELLSMIN